MEAVAHDRPLARPAPSRVESISAALRVYVLWRVLLSVWAVVVISVFPFTIEPDTPLARGYAEAAPDDTFLSDYLLEPWLRWDGLWYTQIARHGYAGAGDGASAFSPLYPALIALLGRLLAGRYLLAALLISNAAAVGMLTLLHRLVTLHHSRRLADRTLIALVLFPTSFYLLAPYTESLFLLLVLGSFLAADRGHWPLAGVACALATLARWQGVLVAPALGWLVLEQIRAGRPWRDWRRWTLGEWRRWLPALWLALIPLALLGTFAYLRGIMGLPLPWEALRAEWEGTFTWPWRSIARTALAFAGVKDAIGTSPITLGSDLIATLSIAALLVAAPRHITREREPGIAFALYGWGQLLLPASRLIGGAIIQSLARYVLLIFPAFIMLARIAGRERRLQRPLILGGLFLTLFYSSMYILWFWVA